MTEPEIGFHHRLVPGEGKDTLLLLHGTGGDESDLLALGRALSPDATLLGVRGRVLEGGVPRFFRRLAPGVFDEEDIQARTRELGQFVREAASRYALDPGRIVALGYSNGANIAAGLLLLEPGLVRRAALLRAMPPFAQPPAADLLGTRVLLSEGRHDPQVSVAQAQALEETLRSAGADVRLQWADAAHQLSSAELPKVRDWLRGTQGAS